MKIIEDHKFMIDYAKLDDTVINQIVDEILKYDGDNVLDYRCHETNGRKFIIGFEREHTYEELKALEIERETQLKREALNILASLGNRRLL
ncbi:hypothetical protein [Staphylococcus hominis]|uniref:hypothetical protein n=1 Tax=Staphylococcus hominis TaxID=1290 RepID=UPI00287AD77C|nr:hypothetical protein [Staphylococcus hominis]MDS3884571.1 hypothetical protein [Staphylococcus hominis]MDS3884717.1 hypothetical protein [Staphylococcus hominis]